MAGGSKRARASAKIRFELHGDDVAAGAAENMWGHEVGNNLYRLANIPFFIYGVSLHDIVATEMTPDGIAFVEARIRSGRSTYRVRTNDLEAFNERWLALKALGCGYESGMGIVAIDVPAPCDIHAVYSLLEAGETAGVWEFEEGHVGHLVERG